MNARKDKAKAQRALLNKQLEGTNSITPKGKDELSVEFGKFFLIWPN